jgi:chitinase
MLIQKPQIFFMSVLLMAAPLAQAESTESSDYSEYIGYWQNFKNSSTQELRLSEIPYDYSIVNIAFASVSAYGNVKFTVQGPPYKAMTDAVTAFKNDLKLLQRKKTKVLLSLGGLNGPLRLETEKKMNTFVSSLEKIITEYDFDGVDYDFEGTINKPTSTNLLAATQKLRRDFSNKGKTLIFTAAPEAIDVNWQVFEGKYDQLINSGVLDFVSVQLYNSTCKRSYKPQSPCYKPGTQDFIVSQADSTIKTWSKRGVKDAESKYVIGVPSAKRAASNGYLSPEVLNNALSCLRSGDQCASYKPSQKYPNIGGIMMWSINWDAINDYEFFENVD